MINIKDTEKKLEYYEGLIEKVKTEKIKAETQLATLETEKEELVKKIEKEGLTPETLNDKIETLSKEIEEQMVELEDWATTIKGVL
jgi:septation ring formation regulator EzrA